MAMRNFGLLALLGYLMPTYYHRTWDFRIVVRAISQSLQDCFVINLIAMWIKNGLAINWDIDECYLVKVQKEVEVFLQEQRIIVDILA